MSNQNKRYFQYLAGDRKGEVVIFDKIEEEDGLIFVCFKDGSRCNEELILPLNRRDWTTQLMAEVDSPSNIWRMEEKWVGRQEEKWSETADGERVCVIPFSPGKKKVTPIPPRPTVSNFGRINQSNTPANTTSENNNNVEDTASNDAKTANNSDPIWIMMDKAKKFETDINMSLVISLPSKTLYEVAKESFENGGEKVIEYIIENLDTKEIKEAIRQGIDIMYNGEKPGPDNSTYSEPRAIEEPIIGEPTVSSEENKD